VFHRLELADRLAKLAALLHVHDSEGEHGTRYPDQFVGQCHPAGRHGALPGVDRRVAMSAGVAVQCGSNIDPHETEAGIDALDRTGVNRGDVERSQPRFIAVRVHHQAPAQGRAGGDGVDGGRPAGRRTGSGQKHGPLP
jgi:hypothetical protein